MVRAPGIGAAYHRERGTDLPAPSQHPYVFFTQTDVAALLAKTDDAQARLMWQRIVAEADRVAGEEPDLDPQRSARRHRPNRLRVLAFAYALTHNPAYAKRAIPEIEWLMKDDSWHVDHSEALVMAGTMSTLGLVYDWMYDALSDDLRREIRGAITEHGIKAIADIIAKGDFWISWYRCNWGAVIYGQAGLAALSILGEEPQAADFVRLAERKIWHYTQSLTDEGGWGESGSYSAYAWSNAMLFMDALSHVTGGQANLFAGPRLRKFPQWFLNLLQPDMSRFVPFADCTQSGDAASILYRLAREYRDGYAQWTAHRMTQSRDHADIMSFLWYDPSLESRSPTDLPATRLFPGLSWAFLRSRWDDPQAILFAFKGGQCDWDHHHHDGNSFALYAYGQPLLVDFFYPRTTWGITAEAHNTIMVNGKDQRGHIKVAGAHGRPDHRTVLGDLVEAPWYARLVGDASLAYDQDDVRSFVREVMYLRKTDPQGPPDYFLVFDDVEATGPMRMDWLLHSYGDFEVNRNHVTVTQGDASADVTMIAPGELAHEIRKMTFEEAGVEQPPGFDSISMLKLRSAEPKQRGYYLSVIVPRRTSEAPPMSVTSIREPNALGATMATGQTADIALFALDAPEASAAGLALTGRSCFVRRSAGRFLAAAVHNGQRLLADDELLFETDSWGHAALTFGDDAIDARLAVYDPRWVKVHVPTKPEKVLVNGKEREFEYEAETRCVKFSASASTREVHIALH
jgi:hypothetical protein